MIKIGCNYLSFKGLPLDIETFIKMSYEMRLDVADFHTRAFKLGDNAAILKQKALCVKYGLPIGYIGVAGNFSTKPEEQQAALQRCREGIDLAAFVGSPLIRVFGAQKIEGAASQDQVFDALSNGLREASEYGAKKGVIVALQNHNHGNIASTGESQVRIHKQVNHPNFSLLMDTGQWANAVGDEGHVDKINPNTPIYDYMEQTIKYASYVRFKYYKIAGGKEELIDNDRVMGILKKAGFNGSISIVYEGKENKTTPERIETIRKAAGELRTLLAKHGA